MVLLEADVAHDVVVCIRILAWPEVPRFFLRVVWTLFQTFHLAFKVEYVVSLFVPKRAILLF